MESGAESPTVEELLALMLTSGVGPVLASRLIGRFGGLAGVGRASRAQLERVRGIGSIRSAAIAKGLRESTARAREEIARAADLGVGLVGMFDEAYPPLLKSIVDPPPVLYVLGSLAPEGVDRYPVAIVGSRSCTVYGIEQAERFGGVLARSGLTVVSGGARGIDTAAHRGAMKANGRTIVVLGCGLAHRYPPDNTELFDRMLAEGLGCLVSELPLQTIPDAKNFPARNRLISGLSLGVVVIEAARGSGALITAQVAAEEHGREVLVVPGRVDSPSSEGSLGLLRAGGAAIATSPADVIESLESGARHLFEGTHALRFVGADPTGAEGSMLFGAAPGGEMSEASRAVLGALDEAKTLDQVVAETGLGAGEVRSAITSLEIAGRVRRRGGRVERTRGS